MKTEVVKIDPVNPEFEIIAKAADYIRRGKLVAIPTETVYGLAADSSNREAVKRLYSVKKRPANKPFTIAVARPDALERLSVEAPALAYKLADKFWPGPLTLVLKSRDSKANGSATPTIGFRMPDNRVALGIIEELPGVDVVLPSANLSEGKAPQSAEEVLQELGGKIELVVDGGLTELGMESTVVDLTQSPFKILREGALQKEEIESAAKLKRVLFICTGNSCRSVMAEGLLTRALRETRRIDVEVLSAGIAALSAISPTAETLDLLTKEGIDMSAHRSQAVNKIILKSADLILVMDDVQERRVLELAPGVRNQLYLLKEFAKISNSDLNIGDPIGRGRDFYEKTFYTIKEAIKRIADII